MRKHEGRDVPVNQMILIAGIIFPGSLRGSAVYAPSRILIITAHSPFLECFY